MLSFFVDSLKQISIFFVLTTVLAQTVAASGPGGGGTIPGPAVAVGSWVVAPADASTISLALVGSSITCSAEMDDVTNMETNVWVGTKVTFSLYKQTTAPGGGTNWTPVSTVDGSYLFLAPNGGNGKPIAAKTFSPANGNTLGTGVYKMICDCRAYEATSPPGPQSVTGTTADLKGKTITFTVVP